MIIIDACLHHIDVANETFRKVSINPKNEDLNQYLGNLLFEVDRQQHNRSFAFASETTEFYTALASIEDSLDACGETLASRLLLKEIACEERMAHLDKTGKGYLNKGSFLEFIYKQDEDDDQKVYLGVKVDHQEFLDERDFKRHLGLAYSKKIYKACKVLFDDDTPTSVFVCDTGAKIALYWWQDFLELKELNTNETNTERACSGIISKLSPIKKISMVDYTYLRNATITAFRQVNTEMRFFDFVRDNLENYVPECDAVNEKMPEIIQRIRALPTSKKFDPVFNLAPGSVKFKMRKIPLREDVNIVLHEGMNNLEDKVWRSRLSDGKDIVIIHALQGFANFKFKNINSE